MDQVVENNIRVCKKCNEVKQLKLFQTIKKGDIYNYRHTCIVCYKKQRVLYNKKNYDKNKSIYKEKYYKYVKKEKNK
jgi:hypothetical protein